MLKKQEEEEEDMLKGPKARDMWWRWESDYFCCDLNPFLGTLKLAAACC